MAFQIGAIGTIFILGLVLAQALGKIGKLDKRLKWEKDELCRVKKVTQDYVNNLSDRIEGITEVLDGQVRILENNYQQRLFLNDKIESVVELLNQEYEESVK